MVVIVGGTGAMGAVITKRLASAGVSVLAVGPSSDALKLLAAETPSGRTVTADIASDEAVEKIRSAIDAPGGERGAGRWYAVYGRGSSQGSALVSGVLYAGS
jgi:NADP-dependent 3-hydroxy acid dehydrogenase YdfG